MANRGFLPRVISSSLSNPVDDLIKDFDIPTTLDVIYAQMNELLPFKFRFNVISKDVVSKLRYHAGELVFKVRTGDYADPKKYISERSYVEINGVDYLENLMKEKSEGYAGNVKITWSLFNALGYQFNLVQQDYEEPSLWLGPKGSITPLHVDGLDNVSFQYFGVKRWLLINPKYYPLLSMSSPFPEAPNLHVSGFDLRNGISGLESVGIRVSVVDVHPGEALYVPAGWAHFVTNVQMSGMVNIWSNKISSVPRILRAGP